MWANALVAIVALYVGSKYLMKSHELVLTD